MYCTKSIINKQVIKSNKYKKEDDNINKSEALKKEDKQTLTLVFV